MLETQLESGDRIVLCSDGIAEVENTGEELLAYERTLEIVRQACVDRLSAETTIDRIFELVDAFKGDVYHGNDMTCVVVKVKDPSGGV